MPVDKYYMEGHKLWWHLDRVNDWLKGKPIVPILIDGGLSKYCNIRCNYCFAYLPSNTSKPKDFCFPREPLLRYLKEAAETGVKAIAFFGEGEPLLNPHVYEAIVVGSKAGLDISMGTNGILMDTGKAGENALEHLTYIKFNISAGTEKGYIKVHRSKEFATAVKKIKFCTQTKRKKKLNVTLGLQMIVTLRNINEIIPLAELGQDMGVDYLQIKPCGDTQDSDLGMFGKYAEYDKIQDILIKAEEFSNNGYQVIVKWNKIMEKGRKSYDKCFGARFLLYGSGDGKLYPCGRYVNYKEDEYVLGDCTKQSFREIIESKRYQEVMEKIEHLDVHTVCHTYCRTDSINQFLWQLKHPPEHVNFI